MGANVALFASANLELEMLSGAVSGTGFAIEKVIVLVISSLKAQSFVLLVRAVICPRSRQFQHLAGRYYSGSAVQVDFE